MCGQISRIIPNSAKAQRCTRIVRINQYSRRYPFQSIRTPSSPFSPSLVSRSPLLNGDAKRLQLQLLLECSRYTAQYCIRVSKSLTNKCSLTSHHHQSVLHFPMYCTAPNTLQCSTFLHVNMGRFESNHSSSTGAVLALAGYRERERKSCGMGRPRSRLCRRHTRAIAKNL